MKRKNTIQNLIRVVGLVILGVTMYESDIWNFIWFFLGAVLVSIIIPIIFTSMLSTSYDGTFLIDETDPTDVKMKLSMDTEMEKVVNNNCICIKIDHRVPNMSYSERSDDNV